MIIPLQKVSIIEELLFEINKDDDIYNEIIKNHLNDRRIIINQEITDDLLENVCLMILKWNSEDKNLPVDKRKKYLYTLTVMVETVYLVLKY